MTRNFTLETAMGKTNKLWGFLLSQVQSKQINIEEVQNEFRYKWMNLEGQIPRLAAAATAASLKSAPQQDTLTLGFSTHTLLVTEHCTLCLNLC